jgi:hypothetical protein
VNKILSVCLVLAASLSALPGAQAHAGGSTARVAPEDLEAQVFEQGPMLLGDLRQAREAGLRRDPWGMAYSLEEARRVLYAMVAAERSTRPEGPSAAGSPPAGSLPPGLTVPLGQVLELDRPEPGAREQGVARFDVPTGSIPLTPVNGAIGRALAALNRRSPAVGAALLATEDALQQVRRDKKLEPEDWSAARDLVLEGYALAVDSHPGTVARLAAAHRALAALSGGEPFVRRLAALQATPAPDVAGLSELVHDLDARVRSLRDAAEPEH